MAVSIVMKAVSLYNKTNINNVMYGKYVMSVAGNERRREERNLCNVMKMMIGK